MKVKDTTCLGVFEVMHGVSMHISKDNDIREVREIQKEMKERGFEVIFSPIRAELKYGGYVSPPHQHGFSSLLGFEALKTDPLFLSDRII
ncbi:hypothetical protein HpRN190_14550 [Helicobacter pylori]